jgi:epoxyqueuosine reductase
MNNSSIDFQFLKDKAFEVGYDDLGYCDPIIPDKDIQSYEKWLKEKKHADLSYMENTVRCFPKDLLPGVQSIVIFLTFYKQKTLPFKKDKGLIASYARAKDYHNVHRSRLKKIIKALKEEHPSLEARSFSDSFPILERALAVKAGLGWLGKNNMLIHPKLGTFTLISGILLSLPIHSSTPKKREDWGVHFPRCGTCRLCQDACPVGALDTAYSLDTNKCLSYHLIESKKAVPKEIQKQNPGYAFGCDLCQDSCPHNIKPPNRTPKDFEFETKTINYIDEDLLKTAEEKPEALFSRPLRRAGAQRLRDNFNMLKN